MPQPKQERALPRNPIPASTSTGITRIFTLPCFILNLSYFMIIYMHVCLCTTCMPKEFSITWTQSCWESNLGPEKDHQPVFLTIKPTFQPLNNFFFLTGFVCGPGCPGTHLLSQLLEFKAVCYNCLASFETFNSPHHPHARRLQKLVLINTVPLMYTHIQHCASYIYIYNILSL